MKMKTRLASLLVILATTGPLLSATETERLRALCAEQELQIAQLELKLSRLTDTPPASRSNPAAPARGFQPVAEPESGTYTVRSGDSIDRIAGKHGLSANALGKLNGLKPDAIIHPGQKLKVPGKTTAAASKPAPAQGASSRTHTVVAGDTFYNISRKYGVQVNALISSNPSVNANALRIGQKIRIDSASTPAQVASNPAPKPAPSLNSAPSIPISNSHAPVEKPKTMTGPIKIEKEISYGQFAKNHLTTTQRLDELNGLELDPSTVLAQGSELYIPAQP